MKHREMTPRSIVAAASGNVLEWYDFTVYGFLAPVIGKVFFPETSHFAATLSAFAVLAIGYGVRPIGSILFGHIGDRLGRKPTLVVTVVIMGVGSLAIALLPGYQQIGITAAVLLVVIRIIQGIAVAGEYPTSGVYIVEQAEPARRALAGSWVAVAMMLGCVLGAFVPAFVSSLLSEAQMSSWGWRVPFLIGTSAAFLSLFMRRHLTESAAMEGVERVGPSPVYKTLRNHWRLLLQMIAILIPPGILYMLIFVYAASYLTDQMHVSSARALDISSFNLFAMAAILPLYGWLADRMGLRRTYLAGALATGVLAIPLWSLMYSQSLAIVFAAQLLFSLVSGVAWALAITILTMISPPGLRCSSVAMGYNLCMAVFCGTTPALATFLVNLTADNYTPIYYFIISVLLSIPVIWRLPKLIAAARDT
ncbi:MFS transporter [Nitratireductor sp. XY-223]|uniref:MFS transporter n=1 Tax=Nitratireductor sp. XY-223 TaxID=2561926 RepID=UPI0019820C1E|nr:MFS transporter [Nitratireductor sp. XY-223]